MNRNTIRNIAKETDAENASFAQKKALETLLFPSKIVGREEKAKELVRYLLGHRHGLAVPFVSVHGRSGCGKSAVTRFVCKNLEDVQYAFVNLRKAKTVFGCANLILSELGLPNVKNAQGLDHAFAQIRHSIEDKLEGLEDNQMFVLVLDEFDALFSDTRGRPSDFVYNLLSITEDLKNRGLYMCTVGISNSVAFDHALDERVKSRIGSSDVFFEPYSKSDVLAILRARARKAFCKMPGAKILDRCAELSSADHGDARRAIDLLRVGSEIAGSRSEKLDALHIDKAYGQVQQDRTSRILKSFSYHQRLACAALARISHLSGKEWHATSVLYKQYKMLLGDKTKPLTYRRISDLLSELKESGLAVSATSSRGRHGYGTQYKLLVEPEHAGIACFGRKWWETLSYQKDRYENRPKIADKGTGSGLAGFGMLHRLMDERAGNAWKDFVGL